MDEIIEKAFSNYLENVSEDAADDLLGLAEDAFQAGWEACRAWMTHPENASGA